MSQDNAMKSIMSKAICQARNTMNDNIGGPFGAAVMDADGNLVAVASNSVLNDHDPTAHAEINAIRKAGKILGTHDLSGCTVITTAFPCPMCLSAIIWANVKEVIYGARSKDADAIGFRDQFIYDLIRGGFKDQRILKLDEAYRDECLTLFKEYKEKNKQLY